MRRILRMDQSMRIRIQTYIYDIWYTYIYIYKRERERENCSGKKTLQKRPRKRVFKIQLWAKRNGTKFKCICWEAAAAAACWRSYRLVLLDSPQRETVNHSSLIHHLHICVTVFIFVYIFIFIHQLATPAQVTLVHLFSHDIICRSIRHGNPLKLGELLLW